MSYLGYLNDYEYGLNKINQTLNTTQIQLPTQVSKPLIIPRSFKNNFAAFVDKGSSSVLIYALLLLNIV
jgi:hypothetical protein